MRYIPLKRLCFSVSRGSAPTYAEGDSGGALAVGQSCQRPDRSFALEFARWHDGAPPEKGRLFGREILINSTGTGTLGRTALVPGALPESPMFVDSHVTLVRVDPRKAEPRYVAYAFGLPTFRSFVEEGLSVGATKQRELNVEALRAHHVPSPELDVQARCADFLDRECERIAELLSELAAFEEALRQETSEAVLRAVEHADGVRLRYRLAAIEQGWSPDCLSRVADGGEVGVLKVGAVNYGMFRPTENKALPPELAPRPDLFVHAQDVLMSRANTRELVGSAAMVKSEPSEPLMLSDKLYRLRPGPLIRPKYLALILNSSLVRGQLEAETSGASSSMQNISQAIVRGVVVPDLSPARQKAVEAETEQRNKVLRRGVAEQARAISLLTEYRDALIAEAVTGKLDVTRVSDRQLDESAHAAKEGERPEVLSA